MLFFSTEFYRSTFTGRPYEYRWKNWHENVHSRLIIFYQLSYYLFKFPNKVDGPN